MFTGKLRPVRPGVRLLEALIVWRLPRENYLDIINGVTPITEDVAKELAELAGTSAAYWMQFKDTDSC